MGEVVTFDPYTTCKPLSDHHAQRELHVDDDDVLYETCQCGRFLNLGKLSPDRAAQYRRAEVRRASRLS